MQRELSASPTPHPVLLKNPHENGEPRFGTQDYRFNTLEPHQIFIEDRPMDFDQWSRLAFQLGMPVAESVAADFNVRRFVHKVKQRKNDLDHQKINDLIDGLLRSVSESHPKIECGHDLPFWRDAIPVQGDQIMQLPTPKPAFTFGYRFDAFRRRYFDLQNGITIDEKDEPCNLGRISQPIHEIYWPFLVVEVRPRAHLGAMLAAKHASAGAAATCNNAIMILSNAAQRPSEYSTSPSLQWNSMKLAQSFSLSVDGQVACLSSHNSQGVLPHSMIAVRSYQLDDEADVQALYSRLQHIMVWAENCRLDTISEILDRLDRRVHSGTPSQTPMKSEFGEEEWNERFEQPRKRNSRPHLAFWDRIPSLGRVLKLWSSF